MNTTTTRRTVIAGAAALPLLPAAALAAPGSLPGNATDAAWSAYQAATARYADHCGLSDAFEAALPTGPVPRLCDFEDRDEWESLRDPWFRERAGYPDNPFNLDDDALDAFIEPIEAAEDDVVATPATTLTDVERKLVVVVKNESGGIPGSAAEIEAILADVRSLMGVAS